MASEIQASQEDHVMVQRLGQAYAELEKRLNVYLDRWEDLAKDGSGVHTEK